MVKHCIVVVFLMLFIPQIQAQTCFAQVQLDRRSVYVQQPFKVTITVLTETWYTAPLEFDNIQIPNAFILPFERTVPGMFTINDKQYAGLQFYYIVFPYKDGSFSIPSISIVAKTPPEGSSVSKKVTLRTKAQTFHVKKIPTSFEGSSWLVAKDVFLQEHWNKPLHNLKTGDVIERTITVNAKGTLPQFIPELKEKELSFAGVYPQDAELEDTRDDYDANGRLTQSFVYLLEKEGDYTLPAVTIEWWNPVTQRLYKRAVPAHKLRIVANPNLGMVTTLKDSLDAVRNPEVMASKSDKGPLLIVGIVWYMFIAYLFAAMVIAYVLIRILFIAYTHMRNSIWRYKESEVYWFHRFMRSSDTKQLWERLYQWWDRRAVSDIRPSIHETLMAEKNKELLERFDAASRDFYGNVTDASSKNAALPSTFKGYRAEYKERNVSQHTISESQQEWT